MVAERKSDEYYEQTDDNISHPGKFYEKKFREVMQELYPSPKSKKKEPDFGRACHLIGALDWIERGMIENQVFSVDGRSRKDTQRLADERKEKDYALVDEIFNLSLQAAPLKRRPRPHRHR